MYYTTLKLGYKYVHLNRDVNELSMYTEPQQFLEEHAIL